MNKSNAERNNRGGLIVAACASIRALAYSAGDDGRAIADQIHEQLRIIEAQAFQPVPNQENGDD